MGAMNWHQFAEWTDVTAMPSNDGWEALREGLIEECHEALSVWHQIEAVKHGAVKRLHRDGPPDARRLEVRQTRLDRLWRQLVEEVGDACWYAARICRTSAAKDIFSKRSPEVQRHIGSLDVIHYGSQDGGEEGFGSRAHWALSMIEALATVCGVDFPEALANNEAKLTARKAAGTIGGEGER